MNSTYDNLSEICESAVIIELEEKILWDYSVIDVDRPGICGDVPIDAATHTYLIYWPGGLAAYLVSKLALNHLQPSFIEAAHATAKQLKPFSPLKRRMR